MVDKEGGFTYHKFVAVLMFLVSRNSSGKCSLYLDESLVFVLFVLCLPFFQILGLLSHPGNATNSISRGPLVIKMFLLAYKVTLLLPIVTRITVVLITSRVGTSNHLLVSQYLETHRPSHPTAVRQLRLSKLTFQKLQ